MAKRELDQGNRDAARVFAWNALATLDAADHAKLLQIAEELDDKLLVRELERRAVPGRQPLVKPSSRAGRVISVLFPLAVVVLAVYLAANTVPGEEGAPRPTAEAATVLPPGGKPLLTERSGIWLVQLGPSRRVPLRKLADELSLRYGYPVGVLPEIVSLPSIALAERRDELNGDVLLQQIGSWYLARGRATIIGVTDYPMFSKALGVEQPFLLRTRAHYAIVSTAHLGATVGDDISGHTRYLRTRKVAARAIGFLYLRLPFSDDPQSLLRSEMSGIDDIDRLDEKL